jgi:peptidoglycan/xylan/chitin deacetylase (PgdA/CDA1 family)
MYITVIAYHKISNKIDFGINTVKVNHFKDQITLLANCGYKPTTFQRIKQGEAVTEKSIVIAFDDGYEDCYTEAAPVLSHYNFPAVIFPITNYIGKRNTWEPFFLQHRFKHLSKAQLTELSTYDFEIGSHGKNHSYLPLLNSKALKSELEDSKKAIEDLIGREVITFCYPYGYFNKRSIEGVKKAGYNYAVAAPRVLLKETGNEYTIPKQSIYATDSLSMMAKKLKNRNSFSWPTISQWLIQKGSFASITLNTAKNYLNHSCIK